MSERLVLLNDKQVVSYGLKDYSKEIEKDNTLITVRLEDFGWPLVIKRGGDYLKLKSEEDIQQDDIVCVNKKDKIIVYRGGTEMQIDSKSLNSATDHVIRPLSKNEIEKDNGSYIIK